MDVNWNEKVNQNIWKLHNDFFFGLFSLPKFFGKHFECHWLPKLKESLGIKMEQNTLSNKNHLPLCQKFHPYGNFLRGCLWGCFQGDLDFIDRDPECVSYD